MSLVGVGCCCCEILFDHFARPAATNDLGSKWSVVRGAWQIESSPTALDSWVLATSSADALVLATRRARDGKLGLLVRFGPSAVGAQARVVWNYVDDQNHHWAEVTFGEPYLNVYDRTLGVDTHLVRIYDPYFNEAFVFTADTGDFGQVGHCYFCDPEDVPLHLGGSVFRFPYVSRGGRFGLATSASSAGVVQFDYVSAHNFGPDGECCRGPAICTDCLDGLLPREMQVVIDDPSGTGVVPGTFFLPFGSGQGVCANLQRSCVWTLDPAELGGLCMSVFFNPLGLWVIQGAAAFRLSLSSPLDCRAIENLDIPISNWSNDLPPPPTCTLTAIA